jgi:hypothetical protein
LLWFWFSALLRPYMLVDATALAAYLQLYHAKAHQEKSMPHPVSATAVLRVTGNGLETWDWNQHDLRFLTFALKLKL